MNAWETLRAAAKILDGIRSKGRYYRDPEVGFCLEKNDPMIAEILDATKGETVKSVLYRHPDGSEYVIESITKDGVHVQWSRDTIPSERLTHKTQHSYEYDTFEVAR